jgi:phage terminase small subunit
MKKDLNERQKKFVEALFDSDVRGNFTLAAKKAGYSENTDGVEVADAIDDTYILEQAARYLKRSTPKAVIELISLLENPPPNSENIRKVAGDILDRAGIVKKDALDITVQAPTGIVILPSKREE